MREPQESLQKKTEYLGMCKSIRIAGKGPRCLWARAHERWTQRRMSSACQPVHDGWVHFAEVEFQTRNFKKSQHVIASLKHASGQQALSRRRRLSDFLT